MFSWGSLPAAVKGLDIGIAVLVVVYTIAANFAWGAQARRAMGDSERGLAVSAIGNFATINVAAAAIILAGVGVLAGLESDPPTDAKGVFTQLSLAAIWLATSLFFGALTAAYVVNHVHRAESVAESPWVMTCAVAQLVSVVSGAIFLVIALFLF